MLKEKNWIVELLGLFVLALVTFPLTVHAQAPDDVTPNHIYLPVVSNANDDFQNAISSAR